MSTPRRPDRSPNPSWDLSWDHNAHYHPWLLRQVPAGCDRALDVGCGSGRFARLLARRVARVDAVDPSGAMIAQARSRTPARLDVRYTAARLDGFALDEGGYGFVSAVSSLHHMPFAESLRTLAGALAPGGVLAVVGHYREESLADHAASAVALVPQWTIGAGLLLARAATGVGAPERGAAMPVRAPLMSLREIGVATAGVLPGAVLRRALMWRYTLTWTRPGAAGV